MLEQDPLVQTPPAQTSKQPPQWLTSLVVSTQAPPGHSVSAPQSLAQHPALHTSPSAQTTPDGVVPEPPAPPPPPVPHPLPASESTSGQLGSQPLQCSGSEAVSTHLPQHWVSPEPHSEAQLPWEQTSPAVQVLPQPPQ